MLQPDVKRSHCSLHVQRHMHLLIKEKPQPLQTAAHAPFPLTPNVRDSKEYEADGLSG
jgi:hypothetical protein